jgi:alginate O-acetyltransferase complex protein AlgJ
MALSSEAREQQAERELGHTEIRGRVARALVALFLLSLLPVAAIQLAQRPPDVSPLFAGVPSACTLQRFERALEDDSIVGGWLRPRLQAALTAGFGVGNEKVYPGRDGRLYHRPDVDYVVEAGFLDADALERRRHGGGPCDEPPQPDPVAAIGAFADELAGRGIQLVVVPTPVKPVVEPAGLARRDGARTPVQNRSYPAFVAALAGRGVDVFDPTPHLLAPGSYLATDTHWRPEAVERVAAALAKRLEASAGLGEPRASGLTREPRRARHYGDLVLLLNLPSHQSLYAPEEVAPRAVRVDGAPWRPTRGAEVLLLGDSFSNVYSDAAAFRSERLGDAFSWGEGAGLAEQLSFSLGRPVDRIVRNAGGASAARVDLARETAREAAAGRDRLAGVRVVVWQFAVRELSQGDWRAPALAPPAAAAPPARAEEPAARAADASARTLDVVATVAAAAAAPAPRSVPYRDALIALHLRGVAPAPGAAASDAPPPELLAYVFGLRDDAATPLSRLAPGARVRLRLAPFDGERVQQRVGSLNRVELDDLELLALPAYFGEPAEPAPEATREPARRTQR